MVRAQPADRLAQDRWHCADIELLVDYRTVAKADSGWWYRENGTWKQK